MPEAELDELVDQRGVPHGGNGGVRRAACAICGFHAVELAIKLGFAPNPDFHEALVGPRPVEVLATPWAAPERPLYVAGPDDDVALILHQLQKAVGEAFQVGSIGEDSLDHASENVAQALPVELNR